MTQCDLQVVNDHIHDRWFSVEDICYDQGRGVWRVLFSNGEGLDRRQSSSTRGSRHVTELIINNVTSVEFRDRQRITWYDFNRLRYSEARRTLDVLTNIPLHIRLHVSMLDVRIIFR